MALVAGCSAARPGPAAVEPTAVDEPVVPPWAERIDELMDPWANESSPGCSVAVVEDRRVAYARGYGMANLEHAVPITPDTVFNIASTSKPFTAAAVLLAEREGKLRLDDDIRTHLPELPKLGDTPTTIRHLLHHTGGLREYLTLFALAGR